MEPHFSSKDCKDEVWAKANELSEENPGSEQKQMEWNDWCRPPFVVYLEKVKIRQIIIDLLLKPFAESAAREDLEDRRNFLDAERIAEDREELIQAAHRKDARFITRAVKSNPLLLRDDDDTTRLVFKVALELREPELFSLIHGLPNKVAIASRVDANNHNLLHRAASLPHPSALHRIQEPALQMQRELQWFKEVDSIVSPAAREWKNTKHKKPYSSFTESHEDLVIEGEKWMKETSNSLILVAILIATVAFASAFSVPGGNNHDPDFLKSRFFEVFVISNTVALFASTISLLVFLGILTSRFVEHDFLRSLPTKLMIGLSTLFLSIEAMIVCFCVGLSIMFHIQSWIVIFPAIGLVHIPVAIFMWRRFILMFNCFMLTYGPSIFDRNVKPWIF